MTCRRRHGPVATAPTRCWNGDRLGHMPSAGRAVLTISIQIGPTVRNLPHYGIAGAPFPFPLDLSMSEAVAGYNARGSRFRVVAVPRQPFVRIAIPACSASARI